MNLKTEEAENLPVGARLKEVIRGTHGCQIIFLQPDDGINRPQMFVDCYDGEGNKIHYSGMSWSSRGERDASPENPVMSEVTYHFDDYTGTELYLQPNYTDFWYPSDPVIVEIKMP